ncbi:hypothetical protein B0T09DRAFT_88282 [Sordaria sp. MPI-SDFR-AT-0083]|nr:hypothetical protein B0T09DRAFT_88282 [Sordaria sp. MPI-SDFR-AT-0083]
MICLEDLGNWFASIIKTRGKRASERVIGYTGYNKQQVSESINQHGEAFRFFFGFFWFFFFFGGGGFLERYTLVRQIFGVHFLVLFSFLLLLSSHNQASFLEEEEEEVCLFYLSLLWL